MDTPTAPRFHGLRYEVEQMDCRYCADRIERVLETIPGVHDAKTNALTQNLQLTLDEGLTSQEELETTLRLAGYPVTRLEQPEDAPDQERARTPGVLSTLVRTANGRLVLTTGLLLALSGAFALAYPPAARLGFALATVLGVAPLVRKAVISTRRGRPFTINTLISLAAIGAVAIGQAAEGAIVVFLFAVGETLEGVAAGRARAGIHALAALTPRMALRVEAEAGGGAVRQVAVEALAIGDLVRLRPGDRAPTDGTIVRGEAGLDESAVTGESVPKAKSVGDAILAGSISTDGVLDMRVSRRTADSTLARIIHLVEEAEASKAPIARFIDRFSRWYTPAAMLAAVLIAVLPPLLAGAGWYAWIYKGIAILLIACPCALVLSVPAAITSGISAGARRGLLIKGGAALETIGSVRTIAFDKTGTLTRNRPVVTDVEALDGEDANVLRFAAAIEAGSSHPLAQAILRAAEGLDPPTALPGRALPGRAVTGSIGGVTHAVGSPAYAADVASLPAPVSARIAALESDGKTVVVLLADEQPRGLIAIRDEPRADARAALARLQRLGVKSVMLTGDNARTGAAIGASLGLDVRAELMPDDKLREIERMRARGAVAMVGDGINDAPALAAADVGIAMGGAADVALDTADAALLHPDVRGVSHLVELSRATMRNVRQNVLFALGLKGVFFVTTLVGLTGLWPAILSDTGATVLVTANALRLLRYEPDRDGDRSLPRRPTLHEGAPS